VNEIYEGVPQIALGLGAILIKSFLPASVIDNAVDGHKGKILSCTTKIKI
jgi:hypothetical protein